MSKSNFLENVFVKFTFNGVVPSAFGTGYLHLHTADPGEAGTSSTNEVAYTGYVRVTSALDVTNWGICDANGTLNANGSAAKNLLQLTWPECTGVSDDVTATHASLCRSDGTILYKGALTQAIRITNLSTPLIPAGAAIFKED